MVTENEMKTLRKLHNIYFWHYAPLVESELPLKTDVSLLNQCTYMQRAVFLIKYPWHTSAGMMCIQLSPRCNCRLRQGFGLIFADANPHNRAACNSQQMANSCCRNADFCNAGHDTKLLLSPERLCEGEQQSQGSSQGFFPAISQLCVTRPGLRTNKLW